MTIPLFKTHFSVGKSIIQVEKAGEKNIPNLVDLCIKYSINPCYLVEDSMAGFIALYNNLKSKGISMIFGLRLSFVPNADDQDNKGSHKNIVFCKNEAGYKRLIKISSLANTKLFYQQPRVDYKRFYELYHEDDLTLAIPFYDSFIHNNSLKGGVCFPEYNKIKPVVFMEDNDLPFDYLIQERAKQYAETNNFEIQDVQSVYYEKKDDVLAYMSRRLMDRKSFNGGSTLEKPNMDGFGADSFCLENL